VDAIGSTPFENDGHHVADSPGVGKTHLAIALGRAIVEAGHSVLFASATALLAALAKAETEGQLADRLLFYSKPKLLIIDELGYLPFERRSAHLFFQLVARRYERGSMLITTNQLVTQWGTVFGDEVLAAAILDRLLHHSHTLMIQGELSIETKEEGRTARQLGETVTAGYGR
jgi:DNA replication protein DnaC